MTVSSSGKYIGYWLRMETGTAMIPIADIFNMIPKVRGTGIHLKVDEEQWRITRGSKRQAGGSGPLAHYMSKLKRIDTPHT